MNFSTFIVKLLERPTQRSFEKDIKLTEVFAIVSTKFKKKNQKPIVIHLMAWGELGNTLFTYYQENDLLVVEGILSLRENFQKNQGKRIIEITLSGFYPYEIADIKHEK